MAQESKPVDPAAEEAAETLANMAAGAGKQPAVESDDESDDAGAGQGGGAGGAAAAPAPGKKKKKPKKKKGKEPGEGPLKAANKAIAGLSDKQVTELLSLNPALADELLASHAGEGGVSTAAGSSSAPAPAESSGGSRGAHKAPLAEMLKQLKMQDIMTGLASSGKNVKDMASYKFWQTQPVPRFDDKSSDQKTQPDGPIKAQALADVPKEPVELAIPGFSWVTLDLTDPDQMKEVYELLNGHYVEDDEAMFRFKYSTSILRWALMSPGWKKEWHVGIRSGRTLCAFISAIPVEIRVRDKVLHGSEVNFLCIHKKLRSRRLAPVLIKEITRLCNVAEVWQAIYTGGIVLPKPVSTCRYFHRALNWQKLYEVGFSPLPPNSKAAFQIRKYAVPEHTSLRGIRAMQAKDVDGVHDLLTRYMKRFALVPAFSKDDVEHWLLPKDVDKPEQVVWSYVVENDANKITDFFSFYNLESSVINNPKHSVIRAAYLFYYATETGVASPVDRTALKNRLNALVSDALTLAKKFNFDVFNALSLMDNALFLEQQKFGPGDGQLHYYLFNYRTTPIAGGVDKKNRLDEEGLSEVGFVML